MSAPHPSANNEPLGFRLLRTLTQEGLYIFTVGEAREIGESLDIGYGHLRKLLSELETRRWITRLKGGLYATSGGLLGNIHVHPFAIATRLVEPSAISHHAALNFHGLTEQIPRIITATTPSHFVTPSMRNPVDKKDHEPHGWHIDGTSYTFTKVKSEFFFGVQQVWVDERFRVPIFDQERTLLDGFVSPQSLGGMGEVLGILEESQDRLDLEKLVGYAIRYNKGAVIKRLGWALETVGVPDDVLRPLKDKKVTAYHLLDPSRPKTGPYRKAWMIQNNLMSELPDETP